VSGPMCGSVSSATVAKHGEPPWWLAARSGTKRWNAKARKGRNRRAYPLAPNHMPGTASDVRSEPHARNGRWRATRGATAGSASMRTATAGSREHAKGGMRRASRAVRFTPSFR